MSDESWRPSSDQTFPEVEKESLLWLVRVEGHRLEARIIICLNWLMDGYFVNRRQFLIRVNDRRMGLEVPDLTVLARGIPVGSIPKDQFDRTALEAAQRIASMIEAEASQLSNNVEVVELRWDADQDRLRPTFSSVTNRRGGGSPGENSVSVYVSAAEPHPPGPPSAGAEHSIRNTALLPLPTVRPSVLAD